VRLSVAERMLWAALCAPALGVLTLVFLWPLTASVAASFTRDGAFTLANYDTVRRLYAMDVAYTIGVAAVGTALTFAAAIPASGWLRTHAFGPVEFLLKVPLFVPFVVVGHALRVFMSPYAPGFASSWAGIAAALAWKHLGLAVLLLLGAFRSVDESYLEAARHFGAGTIRVTRDVLVPMSAASLVVSAILVFSSMLASFSIPLMMGRGGGPQMLMIDVYYRFGQHGDFATASALGVVAYLCAMGAALVYVRRLVR
jgi:ABC-type Fe3+ transport system permease subunit